MAGRTGKKRANAGDEEPVFLPRHRLELIDVQTYQIEAESQTAKIFCYCFDARDPSRSQLSEKIIQYEGSRPDTPRAKYCYGNSYEGYSYESPEAAKEAATGHYLSVVSLKANDAIGLAP